LYFCCKFNRINSDIRYYAYIYNITVQVALKTLKSVLNKYWFIYYYTVGEVPAPRNRVAKYSTFFKTRSLLIIFKLKKVLRAELKQIYIVLDIKFIDLVCNILVR
jgi:hypothetical protein